MPTSTLGSEMTSRQLCEANGWTTGEILRAPPLDKSQLRRDFVVRVVGFGLARIVAVPWDWAAAEWEAKEILLHLPTREWREETHAERWAREALAGKKPQPGRMIHGGDHVREEAQRKTQPETHAYPRPAAGEEGSANC